MFSELLKEFEKVKVGKQEIELWKLKERIRNGEGTLGIEHRELDIMSNEQLGDYFFELARKWKAKKNIASSGKSKGVGKIPETFSLNIPSAIKELADSVGAKYCITGRQICERYLQIRKMDTFDGDAITDLRENVLLDIDGKEESLLSAFVKPIKAGVLNEPLKPAPKHNPTPKLSELPRCTEAFPLIETALKDGNYPHHFFLLFETEHEQYFVINFADTARRSLERPNDAKERKLCSLLAWHLKDGWWRK